jgi:general secretion pathway protein N
MIFCRNKPTFAAAILSLAATAGIAALPVEANSADTNASAAGTGIGQAAPHQPKARAGVETPVGNPVWAVPLSQLSATRDRPIFSPSRRPPAPLPLPVVAKVVEPAKPSKPEGPPLILVGTVAGGDSGIAVFVEQATESVIRLRVNENHQGWILRSIQGREVTLLKDHKSSVLALAPPGGADPPSTQASLEPVRKLPKR